MQRKIILTFLVIIVLVSVTLSVISYLSIHSTIDRSLQNRLGLAKIVSNSVEFFLNRSINRLNDISRWDNVNPSGRNREPAQKMLETIYRYSIFTEGVFLLDKHGNKMLSYPSDIAHLSNLSYITHVNKVLQYGKPVISDIYTIEPIKKKVIFIMTPLKDREGVTVGVAGGILGPTEEFFNALLQSARIEEGSYAEIIDSREVVIASDRPARVLTHHNHDAQLSKMISRGESGIVECRHGFSGSASTGGGKDILAFVPLHTAPWGVILGQSEAEVFAPAYLVQRELILPTLLLTGLSFLIAILMSKNIVRPLKALTLASERIASGDLATPVGGLGSDEILKLSNSFDDMRSKLKESLERIMTQNLELENRVALRTAQIRASRQQIEDLLKKIIRSQEDERKRIARDLHDTILQDVAAFLIKLDVCKLEPGLRTVDSIDEMRQIVTNTIDNIHTVIKDLRPTILDDLGINAAIRWLMDRHLVSKGIACDFRVETAVKRLPPAVEITVFRILQEAMVNIARHSNARNVTVTVGAKGSSLEITVVDDGGGFDFSELVRTPSENGRGLGLLGMKERASLINGRLAVISLLGVGTEVNLTVPLEVQEEHV